MKSYSDNHYTFWSIEFRKTTRLLNVLCKLNIIHDFKHTFTNKIEVTIRHDDYLH